MIVCVTVECRGTDADCGASSGYDSDCSDDEVTVVCACDAYAPVCIMFEYKSCSACVS